jgi:hypothetical protein
MFYRLPVLSEKVFDVQEEGEHFISIAMYYTCMHAHTHRIYPRSAMGK